MIFPYSRVVKGIGCLLVRIQIPFGICGIILHRMHGGEESRCKTYEGEHFYPHAGCVGARRLTVLCCDVMELVIGQPVC